MKSKPKIKNMATETVEEKKAKIYVWAKTERAGQTVIEDSIDGDFTVFTDGTRCRTTLISEMLVEAKTEAQALKLAQPFLSPSIKPDESSTVNVESNTSTPTKTETSEVDVMLEMLRKVSAKNTISMPLEINIPSHEVYELFRDQMDITKEDLNKQILALVLSQIDNLQEQLKPQAQEFINKYYYGKNTRRQSDAGTKTGSRTSGNNAPDITF